MQSFEDVAIYRESLNPGEIRYCPCNAGFRLFADPDSGRIRMKCAKCEHDFSEIAVASQSDPFVKEWIESQMKPVPDSEDDDWVHGLHVVDSPEQLKAKRKQPHQER